VDEQITALQTVEAGELGALNSRIRDRALPASGAGELASVAV
jgi:hypothetical protein